MDTRVPILPKLPRQVVKTFEASAHTKTIRVLAKV
jgi:hypothetical protein